MADWKYKDYTESEKVKNAYQQYAAQKANKPGEYKSAWQGQLDDMLSKIQGREKFSYDANSDAVYQQYKNQYMQGGKLAMQDTMGQAAALTGGYANSYGVTAANQAYQQYLTGLTDKIPELYSLAYDKYNQEGQDMLTQYGLIQDRENTDYSRYRDKVSDYETALDRLYNIYNNERSFDYGQYGDNRTLAYQKYRDAIADEQAAAQLAEQQRQFNENLAWQKQQAALSAASSSSSGSSKSSANVDFHALDTEKKKTILSEAANIVQKYTLKDAQTSLQNYLNQQIEDGNMTDSQALTIYKYLMPANGTTTSKSIRELYKTFIG